MALLPIPPLSKGPPQRRAFLVSLLLAFACVRHAGGALATNFSDQWWNPNESGWGASFLQQVDVIFIDLFVFDVETKQTSFTVAARYQSVNAAGELLFSGDLYLVSGPHFGSPFDPNAVRTRKVGTLTFRATTVDTGVLTYSVDEVNVVKNITRQTWAFENFTGNYYGGLVYDASDCLSAADNGHYEELGSININHQSNTATIVSQTPGGTCTYTASYTQAGHMGIMQGSYSCTNGITGSFIAFEMEKSTSGMLGRFVAQNNLCASLTGSLGGLQR